MFWVDEITEDIIKKDNKKSYLINDSTTPSGHAHIGSLRGIIIHSLIENALTQKGKSAVFQFGYDDFDPMDGRPSYVDESFDEFMGKPLCDIPAPDGKSKSYAEQYLNELKNIIINLGVKAKFINSSELYRSGKFNDAIKIVLDSAAEIRKIYLEIGRSDKGDNWYPLQVVCPKCGKIGSTIVTSWDGKEVGFECRPDLVDWAKGCGEVGKISPFDGNAKMPYKVEWPAKWNLFNIDVEGEGKDHFAASGTRDVADEIYKKIFNKKPPFDIRYEHILVSGAKMSSSKGLGVTAHDMVEFLPRNLLRFIFTRTKYRRAIDFQPEGDTIALLYDEFDRCVIAFNQDPKSDFGRAYYYSLIDSENKQPKYLLRFSKIAYMLQMPKIDILEYARKEKGSELDKVEIDEIENRIAVAKKWLKTYAPDNFKFEISKSLPDKARTLSDEQKTYLRKIAEVIETQNLSGEDLHKKIHEVKNEMKILPRDAFSAIYFSFIGKDSGPQAGWLLASLDKEFVIKRLKEAIK